LNAVAVPGMLASTAEPPPDTLAITTGSKLTASTRANTIEALSKPPPPNTNGHTWPVTHHANVVIAGDEIAGHDTFTDTVKL
jgi:hypothetical protein